MATGRFSTIQEAITFAEANGQGKLTIAADGSITNRFGQPMVYDSSGNLAPSGPVQNGNAQSTTTDSTTTDSTVNQVSGDFGRFATQAEAITFAEANGQGELTLAADGTITNRFGQPMVYDSSGNLAPSGPVQNAASKTIQPKTEDAYIALPELGSFEYQLLLLETGRNDLIGFDYSAHLNTKAEKSSSDLDTYLEINSGADLVSQLQNVNVNELFASASTSQIKELTSKFSQDNSFIEYLSSKTAISLPEVGTSGYAQLLNDTGKKDLKDFDYQAFIYSKTEAEQALVKTGLNDKYTQIRVITGSDTENDITTSSTPLALIGGNGNDQIQGGKGDDIFILSSGDDVLEGGVGKDTVIIANNKSTTLVERNQQTDTWTLTGDNGSDSVSGVERLRFEDSFLALDVTKDQPAGQTALILGALLGPDSIRNPSYVAQVLDYFDSGMDFGTFAQIAIEALELTSNEALVSTLIANIVDAGAAEAATKQAMQLLNDGMTPSELVQLAAQSDLNIASIDLVGIMESGLPYDLVI